MVFETRFLSSALLVISAAFARPFIATPNFAAIFAAGGVPIESAPAFYYSAGPEGYTST